MKAVKNICDSFWGHLTAGSRTFPLQKQDTTINKLTHQYRYASALKPYSLSLSLKTCAFKDERDWRIGSVTSQTPKAFELHVFRCLLIFSSIVWKQMLAARFKTQAFRQQFQWPTHHTSSDCDECGKLHAWPLCSYAFCSRHSAQYSVFAKATTKHNDCCSSHWHSWVVSICDMECWGNVVSTKRTIKGWRIEPWGQHP